MDGEVEDRCLDKFFVFLATMTLETTQRKIQRALSLLLCAMFLVVAVSRDFTRNTQSELTFLQSLSGQSTYVSTVTKITPLFLIKEVKSDIAASLSLGRSSLNYRSLPKIFFVSLIERNSFYVTPSINAP